MSLAQIRKLSRRSVAIQPLFVTFAGSSAAIFMAQLLYWSGKGRDPQGWIYKTQDDWHIETGLKRSAQETSRRKLREFGILEEKLCGIPAQLYYRINFEVLVGYIEKAEAEMLATSKTSRKTSTQARTKSASKIAENQHPSVYTEITHEITAVAPEQNSTECSNVIEHAAAAQSDRLIEKQAKQAGVVIENEEDQLVLAELNAEFGFVKVLEEAKAIRATKRRAYLSAIKKALTAARALQRVEATVREASQYTPDADTKAKGDHLMAMIDRSRRAKTQTTTNC